MKTLLKGIELLPNSLFTREPSPARLLGSAGTPIPAGQGKAGDTLHPEQGQIYGHGLLHPGRDTEPSQES